MPLPSKPEPHTHDLKVWPEYFDALLSGEKTFEFRRDDREPRFAVGDVLRLREWTVDTSTWESAMSSPFVYTGREVSKRVRYIARSSPLIPDGFCCMSLGELEGPSLSVPPGEDVTTIRKAIENLPKYRCGLDDDESAEMFRENPHSGYDDYGWIRRDDVLRLLSSSSLPTDVRAEADAAVARELARFYRREREAEARAVEAETTLEAALTRLAQLEKQLAEQSQGVSLGVRTEERDADAAAGEIEPEGLEWERVTRAAWAVNPDWSKRERQAIEDFILTARCYIADVDPSPTPEEEAELGAILRPTLLAAAFQDVRRELSDLITEANAALANVGPSTHPQSDNALYYPLLFLTRALQQTSARSLPEGVPEKP